jgi:glucose dehydrogenase
MTLNEPDSSDFQYTPGDMWDYDEIGTHIMIDGEVAGQPRKLITHSARNGHLYTMHRHNGQIIGAKPYTDVNWTRGIDQQARRIRPRQGHPDIRGRRQSRAGRAAQAGVPVNSRRQQLLAELV